MGTASKRTQLTRRHEYRVPVPSAYVELIRAIQWATSDFKEIRGRELDYDDDLLLGVGDDVVIVYFDENIEDVKPSVLEKQPPVTQPACGNTAPHLAHFGFAQQSGPPWCTGVNKEGSGPAWPEE